jgi:hypothetical protein
MIWRPDLLMMMRMFLLVLAMIFFLCGTAMLILALPLQFPWHANSDLAARYAVVFLGIAGLCAWGLGNRGENQHR